MSKKIHEIAKSLKKEPARVTATTETHKAGAPEKTREHTPPWLLLSALHQGQPETAETIINESGLTETERILLEGIRHSWREESTKAEQLLSRAAGQLVGVNKCWAHLQLANLFLDVNNDESADYHISRARRYAYEDRQDKQCLSQMVDILDARADIERGAHERAARTLDSLLEHCRDPFIIGLAHYQLGCLGRFRGEIDREEKLATAIRIFENDEQDLYYLALTRFELSYCDNSDQALKLARMAAGELKALGRTREAHAAEARVAELDKQKESQRATAADGYERVGSCLYISAPMRAIRMKLDAIAGAERDPVLILGPRGSGKEMIAQSIHLLSPRRQGPLLAINCGALPDQLVESELFGHEKGAFTGANAQKRGLFELAQGGTLFLDEIGELSPSAQTKLLRVLQTGQFRRVGGGSELTTNARILAATNRDLDDMARQGSFRDDLLDRLSVWRLRIPPLNKRREEILPLAEEFLRRYGDGVEYRLDNSAKQYLLDKEYPGNVRILENDIRRSIGNARAANTTVITAMMICEDFDTFSERENRADSALSRPMSIDEIPNYDEAMLNFERDLLIRALAACSWNKKLAATALGMSERTFWRAIQRHKLHARPENLS